MTHGCATDCGRKACAMTRRGFVGNILSVGAFAGCNGILSPVGFSGDKPRLRFGVVSDVHVRLAKGGRSFVTGYETDTLEKAFTWFRDCGADAVVIAGDMADSGVVGELKAVADVWFRVFPNDRAPDGRKVERIFICGNHDINGMDWGRRVFPNVEERRRESISTDLVKAWDACFHEEYRPFFVKSVKGYDFFCSHWRPDVKTNGYREKGCSGCSEAFRDLMVKSDPKHPFFYIQHPHPRGTVYGKCAWGADDGEATKLLSAFPHAVALSGHSHEPLTNEQAVWRGAFTSVATGSLRSISASPVWNIVHTPGYENCKCNCYLPGLRWSKWAAQVAKYDAPKLMPNEMPRTDIRVGQLVSVYDDRIVFAKREFVSGLSLGDDWIVELPAREKTFAARAAKVKPAEFPTGSALAVRRTVAKTRGMALWNGIEEKKEDVAALVLEFPAATVGGIVAEYEISAGNAAGARYETRICAVGGLYPRTHGNFGKAVTAMIRTDALPSCAEKIVVTPLDSFGNRGSSISAAIPSAPSCAVGL